MRTCPAFLLAFCIAAALAPAAPSAAADDAPPAAKAAAGRADRVDRAVGRGVRYLVSQQDPQEGSISDRPVNRTAMTSLALLAMAAAGHQPADATPEGRAMHRALRYLLHPDRQDEQGYFGNADGSKMYGHGMTTLALAELLGQGMDDETDLLICRRLMKAVELILQAQAVPKGESAQGGWRYAPDARDSDISVTVWQLLALRSARNAGINVPKAAIDQALIYIQSCFISPLDAQGRPIDPTNGFGYTPGSAKYMSTSTTSMGVLALHLLGRGESPIARGGADWLVDHPPQWGNIWLFYGSYYYAQAMFQRGGQHAAKGRQVVATLLLPEQRDDGSWEASSQQERSAGSVYTTSLGILALSVKYHYLPIYQR